MSRLLILYLGGLTLRFLVFAALGALVAFRVRSVATRHAIWTAVLACLLLMPVADAFLPAALVPEQAPEIVLPVQPFVTESVPVAVQYASTTAAVPVPVSRDWWRVALIGWLVVAAALLCRLFVAYRAVHRLKRASLPIVSEVWDDAKVSRRMRFRTPALRESAAVTIPLTVGLWQPVLLLPSDWRDWESWKLRAVLAHELTHVRRMDWALAVASSIARSMFWFNPLVWWLERHLSSLAEQAADEACVRATGDAPRYAEALLQFASTAKNGNRWIGGVAMAQYKISYRIERVLGLRKPGSGVLSKAGWLAVCGVAISTLYVSAAAQSRTSAALPPLSPAEIARVVQQQLPLPEQPATPVALRSQAQQLPPQLPTGESAATVSPEVLTPTASAGIFRYFAGWAAQQPQPSQTPAPAPSPTPGTAPNPTPVSPDLVGEIKLILSPVDQAPGTAPGQIQIRTSSGTSTNSGNAIWSFRNTALDPNTWTWGIRNNAYVFALTGIQGRSLRFELNQGETLGYGCSDCSFLVWEHGAGSRPGSADPGVAFRLSADAKSVTATCRATECRVNSVATGLRILKNAETFDFAAPQPEQSPASATTSTLRCVSVFGNVKADGTPFTAADCPGGIAIMPPSTVYFSVTR
jgi:beta-lactamase regulating signal transducer with metallopeptidase domain